MKIMAINYSSTRGGENNVTASMAILKGLAADGGLFMPDHIPVLDCSLEELSHKTYQEVAYAVMKQFLTDFTEEELKTCIERAYDSKFDINHDGLRQFLFIFARYKDATSPYGSIKNVSNAISHGSNLF